MYLTFFDEVKNQRSFPYYLIGGLCIPESILLEIESEVNDLSEQVFGDRCLSRKTEFYATDLFHGKGLFADISDIQLRADIFSKMTRLVMHEKVGRVLVIINKELLSQWQSAPNIAFMYFCERVDSYLTIGGDIGMLIGDRENDTVAERSSKSLSQYRANGTEFQYGLKITNIFESVHFTHSHLSRFLQLADFYTWSVQFRMRNREPQKDEAKAFLKVTEEHKFERYPNKYKYWPKL